MYKKVIIWGHKFSHYNTFSHIHSSYHKAFKSMGYDTYWFDNDDVKKLANFDFEGSLFFTEAQVDQKIPLIKNATYILHHCNNDKYLETGCTVINLCNYVKYCEEGISFNYKDSGNTVEKIGDLFFYDKNANAMYQPWATDLLPDEIKEEDACLFDHLKKEINYIGSIWQENIDQMKPFMKACKDNKKRFKKYRGGISDEDNRRLIRKSYIAPDIRGEWHKECGYIPCRIFKNISYGQVTGINSIHVYENFEKWVAYSDDTYELFNACVEKSKTMSKATIQESMRFIKNKHTYINRINNILYILSKR
jgi:hypothetical protein